MRRPLIALAAFCLCLGLMIPAVAGPSQVHTHPCTQIPHSFQANGGNYGHSTSISSFIYPTYQTVTNVYRFYPGDGLNKWIFDHEHIRWCIAFAPGEE